MAKDNKDSIIGVRVTSDQKKELIRLAATDGRTLSNFVQFHLEKIIKNGKK